MFVLLLLRAELQQGRSDHRQAHAGVGRAGTDAAQFLPQDAGLLLVESAAAVFLRPGRRRPALLGHAVEPHLDLRVRIGRAATAAGAFPRSTRAADAGRTVVLQPIADFFSKAHVTYSFTLSFFAELSGFRSGA